MFKGAPPETITAVVSARIGIITLNGRTNALPGKTMVTNGARVSVLAFPLRELGMLAPGLPQAGIIGAFIVIVAQADVSAFDIVWLIELAVTVVIHPIADFRRRHQRITLGETIVSADPLASAGAKLIGIDARCPEG